MSAYAFTVHLYLPMVNSLLCGVRYSCLPACFVYLVQDGLLTNTAAALPLLPLLPLLLLRCQHSPSPSTAAASAIATRVLAHMPASRCCLCCQ